LWKKKTGKGGGGLKKLPIPEKRKGEHPQKKAAGSQSKRKPPQPQDVVTRKKNWKTVGGAKKKKGQHTEVWWGPKAEGLWGVKELGGVGGEKKRETKNKKKKRKPPDTKSWGENARAEKKDNTIAPQIGETKKKKSQGGGGGKHKKKKRGKTRKKKTKPRFSLTPGRG